MMRVSDVQDEHLAMLVSGDPMPIDCLVGGRRCKACAEDARQAQSEARSFIAVSWVECDCSTGLHRSP